MGLDSIWDEKGDWLTNKSKGFKARSTGCSCCSGELTTEAEVKEAAISSLSYILRASDFFRWDIKQLIKEARKEVRRNK